MRGRIGGRRCESRVHRRAATHVELHEVLRLIMTQSFTVKLCDNDTPRHPVLCSCLSRNESCVCVAQTFESSTSVVVFDLSGRGERRANARPTTPSWTKLAARVGQPRVHHRARAALTAPCWIVVAPPLIPCWWSRHAPAFHQRWP